MQGQPRYVYALTLRLTAQSVEDITRIVREAQTPPAGPAGWDNDEYIDDAMDQERYDSSSYDEWGAPSM